MSCLKTISCSMGQLKIFIWVKGWQKIFSCSMDQINIFSCAICQLKIFSCAMGWPNIISCTMEQLFHELLKDLYLDHGSVKDI